MIYTFSNYASGWPTDPADASKVSKLLNQPGSGGFSQAIGPNVLLKVMAGDEVAGTVEYYYNNLSVTSNNGNLLNTIVAGFINGITGGAMVNGIIKDNSTAISVANTGSGSPINEYLNNQPIPNQNSTPKAYLNIIFFDEQFRYVGESSEAIMVEETAAGTKKTGSRTLSKLALKNGYVYVYVSNESTNIPVFFDNLIVSHNRGAIVEDNAYYPFGLKIQGISAKAALKPQNGYNYQGAFSEEDSETGYNEFDLRSYDPQLGRWIQTDPYDQFSSPYMGMGSNPINNFDEDGGWSSGLTGTIVGAAVGFAVPYIIEAISGNHIKNKGLLGSLGALLGAGLGYSTGESLSNRNSSNVGTLDMDGGYNGSTNFGANFLQFYSGLVGFNSTISHNSKNGYGFATTPDLWEWIPRYKWVVSEVLTLKGGVNISTESKSTGSVIINSSSSQTNKEFVTLDNPKYKRIKFEPEGKSIKNITILKNSKPVFKGSLIRGNKYSWRNRIMGRANNFEIHQTIKHTNRAANGNTLEEITVSTSPRIIVKMKLKIN